MSKKPTQPGPDAVEVRTVPIAEIEVHAGTQSRPIHPETVAEYAKLWREAANFRGVHFLDLLFEEVGILHRFEVAAVRHRVEVHAVKIRDLNRVSGCLESVLAVRNKAPLKLFGSA